MLTIDGEEKELCKESEVEEEFELAAGKEFSLKLEKKSGILTTILNILFPGYSADKIEGGVECSLSSADA